MTTSDKNTERKRRGSRPGRSRADLMLVAALAGGATLEDAASAAGVSVSTACRRLKLPDFAKLLEEARRELFLQTLNRLAGLNVEATRTLQELLSAETPPQQRLGAAKCVLESSLRFRYEISVTERIAAIEELLGIRRGEPLSKAIDS